MAKKEYVPERKTYVTIRCGKKKIVLETWKYWVIADKLQDLGVDRKTAFEAAGWCLRAKPGESYQCIPKVNIEKCKDSNQGIESIRLEATVNE